MSIAVQGTVEVAYPATRRTSDAVVVVQIRTDGGMLFEAAVPFGVTAAAHARASDAADRIKPGAPAALLASDLLWVADHGRARHVAGGIKSLEVDGKRVEP